MASQLDEHSVHSERAKSFLRGFGWSGTLASWRGSCRLRGLALTLASFPALTQAGSARAQPEHYREAPKTAKNFSADFSAPGNALYPTGGIVKRGRGRPRKVTKEMKERCVTDQPLTAQMQKSQMASPVL